MRVAIHAALARLAGRFGPLEVAPLYRTEPVAAGHRPDYLPEYLNTVALGSGGASPEELLAGALAVEHELGRRRGSAGAPRTIDIDLLFVGDERRSGAGLELPHPRLRGRRFVLAPLADLAPDLPLPPDGATARSLLAALPPTPWAIRLGSSG